MANRTPYFLAFALHVLSFILLCISYGTGYWYVADTRNMNKERQFSRLGLWEACFDGYEHTSDYIGKAYYGCWWIFHKEYSYIREWIMPPWFVAVQTMMTFAVVCEFLGLVIFPIAAGESENTRNQTIACILAGFKSACIIISVVVFAVMIGEDRTWMPRWDINVLGWSFGLAVVAGFFSVFSCIAITVYTLTRKYELLPKDDPAMGTFAQGIPMQETKMPGVPKV